jgi:hypothetical protein
VTVFEIILILIILGLIAFVIYYFFRGSAGNVSISRPMESRVDEYMDRRFDAVMEEYSLITKPRLKSYKAEKEVPLARDESRVTALKQFEDDMTSTLTEMETRLDALEKELAGD